MTQTPALPPELHEVRAAWDEVIAAAEAAAPAIRRVRKAWLAASEVFAPAYCAFVDRAPGTIESQDAAGQVFLDRCGRDQARDVVAALAAAIDFD